MNTTIVKGIVTALSPVVHGMLLSEADVAKRKSDGGSNMLPQRVVKYFVGNEIKDVPLVSGNAIRGEARRLLVSHSLSVLGVDPDHKLSDLTHTKEADARRLAGLFLRGGVTPADITGVATTADAYDKVRKIPFLGLLGGVYLTHHFEGACHIGSFVPLTKETYPLFKDISEIDDPASLPFLADLSNREPIRYTRRAETASISNADQEFKVTSKADQKNGTESDTDKDGAIYGFEYIPAGTKFICYNDCASDDEGVQLAFHAMFALLSLHGYIGGKSAAGHGHCLFDLAIDNENAIEAYDDYLIAHKDEIFELIGMIPNNFKAMSKADKKKKKETSGDGEA